MKAQTLFKKLLSKTGGGYILIMVFTVQLISLPGVILAAYSININAELTPAQRGIWVTTGIILIILQHLILLGWAFLLSKNARFRLSAWARGKSLPTEIEGELPAWKQITSLAWHYGVATVAASIIFNILPLLAYLYYFANANFDQIIYTLIAGGIATISMSTIVILILEYALLPARQVLVPTTFEAQVRGTAGFKILTKFQFIVLGLIFIAILLVAPIGYHQTVIVLYKEIGSGDVLRTLQEQSIAVGAMATILGFTLAFMLASSVSNPVRQLINTFAKVEAGDLSQRAEVQATDEIGELAIHFNRMVAQLEDLHRNLEQQVEERTSQLKAIIDVGRVATSILEPDELISRIANLITEEFGYYYSAVYLIDESGKWVELKEATGDAGKVLKEGKHRLEVESLNIIGRSILTRQAQIAHDIGENATQFNNPLLPYTRSEIALPLYIGDSILGALDVHSTKKAAFNEQDIETLQNMANQVAISLDNARLFQKTRQNLNEMRHLQKQYLREAWIDSNLPAGGMSLSIGEESEKSAKNLVEVPVALRDQNIGQLSLERDEPLSTEEQTWIQAIATQTALALENARLLDESQSIAMREKFVTEITSKIWGSTTIDGVLQTAIRELGQILDATEATIEISVEEE